MEKEKNTLYRGRFALYRGILWVGFRARVNWKRSIDVDNWKKGRCHRAIRACIQDQTDKGLIWALRKNLDCHTIATFMNAYVRAIERA